MPHRPQLVPVLDIMGGDVVRGVAGRRSEYHPIRGNLVNGCAPLAIARALKAAFDAPEFYVADLDAIRFGGGQHEILKDLAAAGLNLCVDAGVHDIAQVDALREIGVSSVVVGLETLPSLDLLSEFVRTCSAARMIFSLDLRQGRPLGPAVGNRKPLDIVQQVVDVGVRRLIVLDLAGVGMGAGIPTLDLCREIHHIHPHLTIWTGGGVRGLEDFTEAGEAGVEGVLVASALHDGRIAPTAWRQWRE